jgi:ADP-ribosylglycohydrolase
LIARAAQMNPGLDLPTLTAKARSDSDVVGGRFSTACYISDSWPSVLYLAYKYHDDFEKALLVNTNAGGDNVHRGSVLGTLLGLTTGHTVDKFFQQLVDREAIDAEIRALLKDPAMPPDI